MTKTTPTYAVFSNPNPDADAEGAPLAVLFCGRSQTVPGHRLGPKVFDHYLIHTVFRGRGIFAAEGREYALGAGDSFVIFPGTLVRYEADAEDPWLYRWIAFKGSHSEKALFAAGVTPDAPVVSAGGGAGLARWYERVMRSFRAKDPGAALRASGCLLQLLAAFADARAAAALPGAVSGSRGEPEGLGAVLVNRAIHYMTAQYAEPITIELMAESLGVSREHLSRVFRERTGVSPVTFLSRLRLDRGRRLLRERLELTVEQVAFSVGFSDPLYFSKQFRRTYGQSPTEYRRSLRQF